MEGALEALTYLTAMNSAEALPEIIFLDIKMPSLSGFDFLERFHDLPPIIRDGIIIVMLTSSLNAEDHTTAMANRYVHSYIKKPITMDELVRLCQLLPNLENQ